MMANKYYTIEMTNGDIYGIPAEVIAENYASYYHKNHDEDYKENFDYMMELFDKKDYDFEDWARGNMNWDEVQDKAVLLRKGNIEVDFQECWTGGKCDYLVVTDDGKVD